MNKDPLTDIVRSLDLLGAVFLEAEFTAPWAITAHVTEDDCRPFMAVPKQVIAYHVVTAGEARVSRAEGSGSGDAYRATAGDVILLPSNPLHVLSSGSSLSPVSGDDLLLPQGENGLVQIRHGGGGDKTKILCGFLACSTAPSTLIETLPELLVIGLDDIASLRWIEASIAMAARELSSGRIASGGIISRLSELLLVEALRAHLDSDPVGSGWLSGMADPKIARALARIHSRLSDPPEVTELAEAAGMSRSAFVDRFANALGVAPGRYVQEQRMNAARLMLRDTSLGLAEIANRVGYGASESFFRAFKREMGETPAEFRARTAA